MSAHQQVLRSARRAVIAGIGALAIVSAVGGADQLGQARADDGPQCDANTAVACSPGDTPSEPAVQSATRPRTRLICQPARIGAFCYRINVH